MMLRGKRCGNSLKGTQLHTSWRLRFTLVGPGSLNMYDSVKFKSVGFPLLFNLVPK